MEIGLVAPKTTVATWEWASEMDAHLLWYSSPATLTEGSNVRVPDGGAAGVGAPPRPNKSNSPAKASSNDAGAGAVAAASAVIGGALGSSGCCRKHLNILHLFSGATKWTAGLPYRINNALNSSMTKPRRTWSSSSARGTDSGTSFALLC